MARSAKKTKASLISVVPRGFVITIPYTKIQAIPFNIQKMIILITLNLCYFLLWYSGKRVIDGLI